MRSLQNTQQNTQPWGVGSGEAEPRSGLQVGQKELPVFSRAFKQRFGKHWRRAYHDLREAQDPEAFTVAKRRFASDRPGKARRARQGPDPRGKVRRAGHRRHRRHRRRCGGRQELSRSAKVRAAPGL